MLGEFKLYRTARLPLAHGGAFDGIATQRHVLNLETDEIAAPELAVYSQIEQSQVALAAYELEMGTNGPDVPRLKRWFWACVPPFVPWLTLCRSTFAVVQDLHNCLPWV